VLKVSIPFGLTHARSRTPSINQSIKTHFYKPYVASESEAIRPSHRPINSGRVQRH